MITIQELPAADLERFVDIVANAYPGFPFRAPEDRRRQHERMLAAMEEEPTMRLYGAYRDGQLVGGMRLFDFHMTLLSAKASAGGVGLVAVDLLHKKQHVARELIRFFLRHYRQRGAPIALLYPFRPDFYRRMGFGFATRLSQYRIPPARLPRGDSRAHVRYARAEDVPALLDCYTRYADRTNGMIERAPRFFEQLLANHELRVLVYEDGPAIQGYAVGTFKALSADNPLLNDLVISELIYEHSAALAELLTVLHTQADQLSTIVFNVQDESFYHLFDDPRNDSGTVVQLHHPTNSESVGLMCHVIDVPGIFAALREHDFGGQTCRLRLTISDTMLPENAGSTTIAFTDGRAEVQPDAAHDVALQLDVADFSALLVGAISLRQLLRYGRATLSDPAQAERLQRLFAVEQRPVCMTRF